MRKKAKKVWVNPVGHPNGEINVTPLVDVVLVLLIIFMVVTPLLEKNLDVRVPATEKVDEVAEVPADQLVVRLDAQGALRINTDPVKLDDYIETLREKLSKRPENDRLVFVVADDAANYGTLVAVLDGAKVAGAETLGMMTERDEESEP